MIHTTVVPYDLNQHVLAKTLAEILPLHVYVPDPTQRHPGTLYPPTGTPLQNEAAVWQFAREHGVGNHPGLTVSMPDGSWILAFTKEEAQAITRAFHTQNKGA